MSRDIVRWPDISSNNSRPVAVVTVSYNTRELTALLLWSLHRVLSWSELEIVIVDNGSQDGSAQLLAEAERAGLCILLANADNVQHGPALNQGISWLAGRGEPVPAWIWVLDSDAVIARSDALIAAHQAATSAAAALLGEPHWDRWHQVDRFELYSLLLDPAQVWREGISAFTNGGAPSWELLRSAADHGLAATPFPFAADGYLIHLGRGSLAAIFAAGEESNPLYSWAMEHHDPHFGAVPDAEMRYRVLLRRFHQETGHLTGASLVAACRREPDHFRSMNPV